MYLFDKSVTVISTEKDHINNAVQTSSTVKESIQIEIRSVTPGKLIYNQEDALC